MLPPGKAPYSNWKQLRQCSPRPVMGNVDVTGRRQHVAGLAIRRSTSNTSNCSSYHWVNPFRHRLLIKGYRTTGPAAPEFCCRSLLHGGAGLEWSRMCIICVSLAESELSVVLVAKRGRWKTHGTVYRVSRSSGTVVAARLAKILSMRMRTESTLPRRHYDTVPGAAVLNPPGTRRNDAGSA